MTQSLKLFAFFSKLCSTSVVRQKGHALRGLEDGSVHEAGVGNGRLADCVKSVQYDNVVSVSALRWGRRIGRWTPRGTSRATVVIAVCRGQSVDKVSSNN
jgi:hypothetical protein